MAVGAAATTEPGEPSASGKSAKSRPFPPQEIYFDFVKLFTLFIWYGF